MKREIGGKAGAGWAISIARVVLCLCVFAVLVWMVDGAYAARGAEGGGEGMVEVAALIYADGRSGVCFSNGFLEEVGRRTEIRTDRAFHPTDLASAKLFDHPFAVMSGEGAFTLSEEETRNLEAYLGRGGFLLASAGCSNADWADSFKAMITRVYGDEALRPIALDHPIFDQVFRIESIQLKRPMPGAALYGLWIDDRLSLIFTSVGLNETAEAGEGCCCCGGNEVRNARQINANVLVYALTH